MFATDGEGLEDNSEQKMEWIKDQIFPRALAQTTVMDRLSVLQGILNDRRGSGPGFLESYLRVVDPLYPQVKDGLIQLKYASEHFEYVERVYINPKNGAEKSKSIFSFWRFEGKAWKNARDYGLLDSLRRSRVVYVAAKLADIRSFLEKSREMKTLEKLGRARRVTLEDELSIVKRGRKGEDRFIPYDPQWPAGLLEEFNIGGNTHQVHIL
jgi:hypothetical protein